jgi:predicted nuclease of restriction endonuclease-like RecB superfamily
MLTADLVRASSKEGRLKPGFVDYRTDRIRERADEILAAVRAGIGRQRGEIEEDLEGLLGDATDRKLFAGFAKVVFDSCDFATQAPVEPRELRRLVWLESARRGPLALVKIEGGASTATEVYEAVAATLPGEVAGAALADAMYADHPDEQRLTACALDSGERLVERYNLGLVQALLFSAHHLDLELASATPARMRAIFRALKFHQLLASVAPLDGGYRVRIDGPAALFSQSSRYGVALAKFLPSVLHIAEGWRVRAEVAWGRFRPTLELSPDSGLRSEKADVGSYETREAEWFRERFEALDSGWALDREPLPLPQGEEAVVIPDFSFRKEGRVAHLEILGFWRKGSIERRIELLRKHGPANLVVAVSKRYATDKDGELPDSVVPFAEVVPAKEVLRRVEQVAIREGAGSVVPRRRTPRR